MESIGQLAAGIAHEIYTPTQYIGDNTRFVQDSFHDLTALLAAAKQGTISPERAAEVDAAATTANVDYLIEQIPRGIEQSLQGVQRMAQMVGAMKDFSHPVRRRHAPRR